MRILLHSLVAALMIGHLECQTGQQPTTGSTQPSTAATSSAPDRPATTQSGASDSKAMQIAVEYVAERNLDWTVDRVVQDRNGGYTVFFKTPADEDRVIGPRTVRISPSGNVSAAPRR